jgi:predicted nucleic acid-binding protein
MIVADASVVLKWIMNEQDTEYALAIREKHVIGESIIAVPDLLFYEIANVLATKISLEKRAARSALRQILALELEMYHFGIEAFIETLETAIQYKITVYDSTYIILAKRLGCPFITADKQLWNKVKDLGFVQLLGNTKLL